MNVRYSEIIDSSIVYERFNIWFKLFIRPLEIFENENSFCEVDITFQGMNDFEIIDYMVHYPSYDEIYKKYIEVNFKSLYKRLAFSSEDKKFIIYCENIEDAEEVAYELSMLHRDKEKLDEVSGMVIYDHIDQKFLIDESYAKDNKNIANNIMKQILKVEDISNYNLIRKIIVNELNEKVKTKYEDISNKLTDEIVEILYEKYQDNINFDYVSAKVYSIFTNSLFCKILLDKIQNQLKEKYDIDIQPPINI